MISQALELMEQLYIVDKPWTKPTIFTYVVEIRRFDTIWAGRLNQHEKYKHSIGYFLSTKILK